MTILLQQLAEYAWIFYVVCAGGALFYTVRALIAHREHRLALFTLEREAATSRAVQAWAMVLIFVLIGASIFFVVTIVLPDLPIPVGDTTPAPTGLALRTPAGTPSPTSTPGIEIPTLSSATREAIPTPIPPVLNDTPIPEPTSLPLGPVSGEVYVQFGDPPFVELVSYGLSAAEVATGESLQLTLSWRALGSSSPVNYVVFTHLRKDDGSIIAQHDGPPGGGARPLMEWVPGEVVVDVHVISFNAEYREYTGPATIAVGLYNPEVPGDRVRTGAGVDYVTLPVTVNVVSR